MIRIIQNQISSIRYPVSSFQQQALVRSYTKVYIYIQKYTKLVERIS